MSYITNIYILFIYRSFKLDDDEDFNIEYLIDRNLEVRIYLIALLILLQVSKKFFECLYSQLLIHPDL